jgi:predicted SprT family Zn-dependent metalloprotease
MLMQVVDCDYRLRETLLHEMCHAAAWLLDGIKDPPHGPVFKKWGQRAMKKFPELVIETCHSYQVHKPHEFRCTQESCGVVYGRHTKQGIDLDK